MDENGTSIEDIAGRVEGIITNLAQFTAQFTLDCPDATVSMDVANRIGDFLACVYMFMNVRVC
jgi:hypothetical protein